MDTVIEIKEYLPHRSPMLMVDTVIYLDKETVETVFKLKEDNIFIHNNLFIESGLIENAAQTCATIVAKDFYIDENNNDKDKENVEVIGFISAIKSLKIHQLPTLGHTIHTKATLSSTFQTDSYILCTMKCNTFADNLLLLEGEINLFIQEIQKEVL